ncbi:MAG: hypothetical protein HYR60_07395 [Acidobacteria bacterium]|nr:hypothetical protein [Acidobacteriota bacterium]
MPNLKKTIEQNAFIVLIGCVVASVGIAAGVQQFFYKQQADLEKAKCEARLDDLNSKLASIKRGISGGEYLDLRKVMYSAGETPGVSQKARFFSEDQFYAESSNPDLEYSTTTELELLTLLTGIQSAQLPQQVKQLNNLVPLHLWKARTVQNIKGSDIFTSVFPYITVEKIPMSKLKTILGLGASMAADEGENEKAPKISLSEEDSAEAFAAKLEQVFRGDIVGAFFTTKLMAQMQMGLSSSKTAFNLIETQKVGNALYSQTVITLKDAVIGGKSYPLYYLRQELVLVSTPENLYAIQTFIPGEDPEPRGRSFSLINQWLSDFRIRLS